MDTVTRYMRDASARNEPIALTKAQLAAALAEAGTIVAGLSGENLLHRFDTGEADDLGFHAAINAVEALRLLGRARHDALRPQAARQIGKSIVVGRLTDAQLDAALAVMTPRQKERWRAPDHPAVNVDDPELLAVLAHVGADAHVVLAG